MLKNLLALGQENLKEIIADFPKGATHRIVIQYDCTEIFLKLDNFKFKVLDENNKWITPPSLNINDLKPRLFEELQPYYDALEYLKLK